MDELIPGNKDESSVVFSTSPSVRRGSLGKMLTREGEITGQQLSQFTGISSLVGHDDRLEARIIAHEP